MLSRPKAKLAAPVWTVTPPPGETNINKEVVDGNESSRRRRRSSSPHKSRSIQNLLKLMGKPFAGGGSNKSKSPSPSSTPANSSPSTTKRKFSHKNNSLEVPQFRTRSRSLDDGTRGQPSLQKQLDCQTTYAIYEQILREGLPNLNISLIY